MEFVGENIIYSITFLFIAAIVIIYLLKHKRETRITNIKIEKAKEYGFHEPVSLHPVVDLDTCIGSGACIAACPEKDILGLVHGQAKVINASRCVGHGACFHACPVEAITLCIGTEKRGVDLPHINSSFETNIPGVYIAGELGGMGLIKNAVEQGKQASENIKKKLKRSKYAEYDIVIVGAGPAGISATLNSVKNNLKYATLEQDSLGGTVFSFPRAKVIMTAPMDLPLHGKVKLSETSKSTLLSLWREVISKNNIKINEQEKVEVIEKVDDYFVVKSSKRLYKTNSVLIAIGRRGTPRKLGIPGETKEKVYYRLLEPEVIKKQRILIIGGGDSAIESALLLADENKITISYRSGSFARLKPKNLEKLNAAVQSGKLTVVYNSNVKEILDDRVIIEVADSDTLELENDLVYIFAGGELPIGFLEKTGIMITRKFGEVMLTHKK